jgi:hypothetical protein
VSNRSAVAKEEIHQRSDDEQCQQEAENGPTAARLGNDCRVADRVANAGEVRVPHGRVSWFRIFQRYIIGLNRAGELEIPPETQSVRTCLCGEPFSVYEYLNVSRTPLRGKRRQQLGHEVFSHKAYELLYEVTFDLHMAGSFDRLSVRVGGIDGEAACRLVLDMEGKFELLIFERELQAWKFRGETGSNVCLDLLLQFFARGGFERWDCGIGSVRDESAFGPGLDAISEMRDKALEVHVARL